MKVILIMIFWFLIGMVVCNQQMKMNYNRGFDEGYKHGFSDAGPVIQSVEETNINKVITKDGNEVTIYGNVFYNADTTMGTMTRYKGKNIIGDNPVDVRKQLRIGK